jgi:hypothetical protein
MGLAVQAWADDPCPDVVNYDTGSYLKSGSTYFYPTGSYLMVNDGDTIYYPTGSYLKTETTFYYQTGNYLSAGDTLYYPTGNYLQAGGNYYYQNGNYLEAGDNFFYQNGSYARSGTTLYEQNGTVTQFPVELTETLGDYGKVDAKVDTTSQDVRVIAKLLIDVNQVSVTAIWKQAALSLLKVTINAGDPNQNVVVRITSSGSSCSLETE